MPSHFYLLIAKWMDDASLCSLTATCHRMHELLPRLLSHRLSVEIKWRREEYVEDGVVSRCQYAEDGFVSFLILI